MNFHPDVLAAHAEFGGDLESMQKLYEYPTLKAENERLEIAKRAIALLAAMRTAFKELEQLVPGSFDSETWAVAFKAQAWPRSGKYKRMADLSETDVHEAQERGVGAVAKL